MPKILVPVGLTVSGLEQSEFSGVDTTERRAWRSQFDRNALSERLLRSLTLRWELSMITGQFSDTLEAETCDYARLDHDLIPGRT